MRDWEPEFSRKIENFLKQERNDALVGSIEVTDRRVDSIYKMGQERVVSTDNGVTVTISAPIISSARPTRIEFDLPIRWLEREELHEYSTRFLAERIAWKETQTTLSSLSRAQNFPVQSDRISVTALTDAIASLQTHGYYPDTLTVNPRQKVFLETSKDFFTAWLIPSEERTAKGPYFAGILNGIDVYWTAFLEDHTALLYNKSQVRAVRSPLHVEFGPSYQEASYLSTTEEFLVWSVDDRAVTKISLAHAHPASPSEPS